MASSAPKMRVASAPPGDAKKPKRPDDDQWVTVPDKPQTAGSLGDMKAMIPRLLGNGKKGSRGYYGRFNIVWSSDLTTNPSQPKYLMYFPSNSSTTLAINTVGSSPEWGSFNAVFDEFFVHSAKFVYEPINANGGALVDSSTANNQQSAMMVIAGYQHNQAAPTDNSDAVRLLCDASQHKICNTARPHTFTWRNIEKFAKDGPLTDSGSSGYSQGWINVTNFTHYGGTVYVANAHPTGAAVGLGTWATSITTGTYIVKFDVSFRYRS